MRIATLLVRRALATLLAAVLAFAPPVAFASQDFRSAHAAAMTGADHDHHADGAGRDLHKHSHSHDRSAPDHSHDSGGAIAAYPLSPPVLHGDWVAGTQDHVHGRTSHPPERPPRLIART